MLIIALIQAGPHPPAVKIDVLFLLNGQPLKLGPDLCCGRTGVPKLIVCTNDQTTMTMPLSLELKLC